MKSATLELERPLEQGARWNPGESEFKEVDCVSCVGHAGTSLVMPMGRKRHVHTLWGSLEMGLHEANRGCAENYWAADMLESRDKHMLKFIFAVVPFLMTVFFSGKNEWELMPKGMFALSSF